MTHIKEKLVNRLTGFYGEDILDFALYEFNDMIFVYPKAYGESVMFEEPHYYAAYIVNTDGEVLKDRTGILGTHV